MEQQNSGMTEIPGFGSYILAAFLTPIYYMTKGKWMAVIVTAVLYVVSFLTMPLLGLGMLFWALAAAPACWGLRSEIIVAHAKRTGEETAAAMARQQAKAQSS